MRIVRFLDRDGQPRYGRVPLGPLPAEVELLEGDLFKGLKPAGRRVPLGKLLAPVSPPNIFCIGANYAEHVKESGHPMPDKPVIFMKPTTAIAHPGDAVLIPKACRDAPQVDFECELVVVIGRTCRDATEADALSYVLGYTAANDISARIWQRQGGGGQWIRGKSFDTFCPLGPTLVTAGDGEDSIADPQAVRLSTTVNGQVMQNNTTADMIFPVRTLIAFISRDTTLLPGTIILTGTPQGVGMGRNPPAYLKDGDKLVVELDKIGRLENAVQQG